MLVGLYGNGKTTTCGKLAKFFHKRGLKTGLIAGDTHRPAAYDQLQQLAQKINVSFYGEPKTKNAVKVVKAGLKEFKKLPEILSGLHVKKDVQIAINNWEDIACEHMEVYKEIVRDAA